MKRVSVPFVLVKRRAAAEGFDGLVLLWVKEVRAIVRAVARQIKTDRLID